MGLFNPKTPANIGSVLRSCNNFQVSLLSIEGTRFERASTDTGKSWRHIPMLRGNLKDFIPYNCVPVAVDLVPDAENLVDFDHPERAYYIFGPEDGTLGKHILDWCPKKVYIPTNHCMNLAQAVNVVLYDRMFKRRNYV